MPIDVLYFLMSSLLTVRTVSAFAVADVHIRRSALSSCHFIIRANHQESAARNRHARFRRRRSQLQMTTPEHGVDSSQLIAKDCMKILSRRGKTWERLGDIVQLSISSSNGSETKSTIADIGTDHGLLAIALAATGRYEKVIGADVSEQALENGALSFYRKVQEALARDNAAETYDLPVEFRFGNGLSVLNGGEANSVAIAGMGVNTMMQILNEKDLQRIGTTTLVLQPTNSKPLNMIKLYDFLQARGFTPKQEVLRYISRRWYFTFLFERDADASPSQSSESFDPLPGDKLRFIDNDDSMHREFMRYVEHHRQWLRDLNAKGTLSKEESRWFNVYGR